MKKTLLAWGIKGDFTTQLCGDYSNHYKDLYSTTSISWKVFEGLFGGSEDPPKRNPIFFG